MLARSEFDLHNIRQSIERVVKLSDNIVGVGPLGVGLDGLLSGIPGLGELYSLGAGGLLLVEGVKARASTSVLLSMTAIILADAAVGLTHIPLVSQLADTLFTGHKWAGNMLLKHMDDTLYYEGTRQEAQQDLAFREHLARVRAGKEKRRIVFLG